MLLALWYLITARIDGRISFYTHDRWENYGLQGNYGISASWLRWYGEQHLCWSRCIKETDLTPPFRIIPSLLLALKVHLRHPLSVLFSLQILHSKSLENSEIIRVHASWKVKSRVIITQSLDCIVQRSLILRALSIDFLGAILILKRIILS